jgi:Mitochondrial carrier protein
MAVNSVERHLLSPTIYAFLIHRVASTVTYPLQVIKSRMQQPSTLVELTSSGDVRVVQGRSYVGLSSTIYKIWQQEGVSGFFKGAIPNAVRVAPSAAVTFVVYEAIMDALSSSPSSSY